MTVTATYFSNFGPNHFFGWTPGAPLTKVADVEVPGGHTLDPAEYAFVYFQRVDGQRPGEAVLDAAEAPSMSVGDVVCVQVEDGNLLNATWHACESVGFRELTDDEIADLNIIERPSDQSVAQLRGTL
jgi:hypothetical protein